LNSQEFGNQDSKLLHLQHEIQTIENITEDIQLNNEKLSELQTLRSKQWDVTVWNQSGIKNHDRPGVQA